MSFQEWIQQFPVSLPNKLQNINNLKLLPESIQSVSGDELMNEFPNTYGKPLLRFSEGSSQENREMRVGVVFSGGQASGGHNVITGLYDALMRLNLKSELVGFLNGPDGILKKNYKILSQEVLHLYRNQGGFDLLGSGRTKIETEEQIIQATECMKELKLDGLVVIGGDDSNTNAVVLGEAFLKHGLETTVVGVPKTVDGDLKGPYIETSFGFDTATKVYSNLLGNIARDSLSAKKYTFFVKLMGRSASHIALECAHQIHPNYTLISEEIERDKKSFGDIVSEISDLVCKRSKMGKDYGIILIPEGVIEFIPEFRALIDELNTLLAKGLGVGDLSDLSKRCFNSFPEEIQKQLLLDRDDHGNVQVSKIETERLFSLAVSNELKKRKKAGDFVGRFSPQNHFLGYEGRSCYPTPFDAHYCYGLGFVSALLLQERCTGYMAGLSDLSKQVDKWEPLGLPITSMLNYEMRNGKKKAVIKKSLVELDGKAFLSFKKQRGKWASNDDYKFPPPIQYREGEVVFSVPLTTHFRKTSLIPAP